MKSYRKAIAFMAAPDACTGGSHEDRSAGGTRLHLEDAPLILDSRPELRARIRGELKSISGCIKERIPRAAVLLTGSLSVGEGRPSKEGEGDGLESDYDIVVVTSSLWNTMPRVARRRLLGMLREENFSADLEITLIWKPMLALRLTTTAGLIVDEVDPIRDILKRLRAPRAVSALEGAYAYLAGAPLAPSRSSELISKAFIRAAQAYLLQRSADAPRRDWVGLSSIRVIQQRLDECAVVFDKSEIDRLRRAGAHLLRQDRARWGGDDVSVAREILKRLCRMVARPSAPLQTIKHAAWLIANGILAFPRPSAGLHSLRGLQLLADAWDMEGAPEMQTLAKAAREAAKLLPGGVTAEGTDPVRLYTRLYHVLTSYVSYYPNKLKYPGNHQL